MNKLSIILFCFAALVHPSEQLGLRRLSIPAQDCNAVAEGFKTCKNDSQYWICQAGWGPIAMPIEGGTKCCPDGEGGIFMVNPNILCHLASTKDPTTGTINPKPDCSAEVNGFQICKNNSQY